MIGSLILQDLILVMLIRHGDNKIETRSWKTIVEKNCLYMQVVIA